MTQSHHGSCGRRIPAFAMIGAASGLRSQTGLAALALRADPALLPPAFRDPRTRRLLSLAAVGELVVDKLPFAPSRLEPPGLAARLVLGAVAGGLLAHTRGDGWALGAAVGSASAAVAAKVGHDLRAKLDERFPDLAVAPVEDALAVGLAVAATRIAAS